MKDFAFKHPIDFVDLIKSGLFSEHPMDQLMTHIPAQGQISGCDVQQASYDT